MHSFEVSLGYESVDRTTFSTWSTTALHWICTSVNAFIPQWNFKRMHSILKWKARFYNNLHKILHRIAMIEGLPTKNRGWTHVLRKYKQFSLWHHCVTVKQYEYHLIWKSYYTAVYTQMNTNEKNKPPSKQTRVKTNRTSFSYAEVIAGITTRNWKC